MEIPMLPTSVYLLGATQHPHYIINRQMTAAGPGTRNDLPARQSDNLSSKMCHKKREIDSNVPAKVSDLPELSVP